MKHIHIHIHDVSPIAQEFATRRAARKNAAQLLESEAVEMENELKRIEKDYKKKDKIRYIGDPISRAKEAVKHFKAAAGLAGNDNSLSIATEHERWMQIAHQDKDKAEAAMQSVRR
jgi:hypothetical protein